MGDDGAACSLLSGGARGKAMGALHVFDSECIYSSHVMMDYETSAHGFPSVCLGGLPIAEAATADELNLGKSCDPLDIKTYFY